MKVKDFIKELIDYDQNMDITITDHENRGEGKILVIPTSKVVYQGDHDAYANQAEKDLEVVLIE